MKRILCPTDYSQAAINAVEYAAQLAKNIEAELILLQILEAYKLQDIANVSSGFSPAVEKRENEAQKKLEAYSQAVEEEFSVKCHARVKSYTSGVDTALKKEVERENYDLIVMGTNGADDLRQFYFGTHTYNVLRNSTTPFLIVPEECPFKEFKDIIYALDYIEGNETALKNLMQFSRDFNPNITVLHISEKPTAISQQVFRSFKNILEDSLGDSRIRFQRIVEEDTPLAIDNYTMDTDADLLVLLTKKYSLTERIFHTSLTKKLSFIASYPMLVYNREELEYEA